MLGRSTQSLDVMRKWAIQAAGYLYVAGAVYLGVAAIVSLLNDEPPHVLAALLLAVAAAFCAYMATRARALLRTSPAPSRMRVAVWAGASLLIGGLGGVWLVVGLFIPYLLLTWAVRPVTA